MYMYFVTVVISEIGTLRVCVCVYTHDVYTN